MTKKLYSTEKWKERSWRKQRDELRKKRRARLRSKEKRPKGTREDGKARRSFVTVTAPVLFSLIKNPDGVIAFLRDTQFWGARSHVAFDLSGVTTMTADAVAALTAAIRAMPKTVVRGNLPSDPAAADMLMQSGFFDYVRSIKPLPTCTRGKIAQEQSKKVEPRVARDLIHRGTEAIHGVAKPHFSTYRVLIESMSNTHNHAAKRYAGSKTWWATVYADHSSGRACYTFLDIGVGIFRSMKVSPFRRLYRKFGTRNNVALLKDILDGKVESRTGKNYRGKGLPAIYRLLKEGKIHSLVIITNDVYANVSTGDFRVLPTEFAGTLLYWEN